MNCLPSEDNPQEANLQIDKYLIDILRSASGKNDAAPKRGKKISFTTRKDLSISTEKILNQKVSKKVNIRYGY